MKKITLFLILVIAAYLAFTGVVKAASSFYGDAQIVSGGNPGGTAQLRSDDSPGWGGINFDDLNGSNFSSLTTLSTDFNVTDDNCGAGSPRFSIEVDYDNNNVESAGDKNVFVYLGPFPNYDSCSQNTWLSSGNLVNSSDNRWDTSQVGGTFYDSHANAVSLVGNMKVLNISLDVDSGWNNTASGGDGEQTVLVDNTTINTAVYPFDLTTPTLTPTPTPINAFNVPAQCNQNIAYNHIVGKNKAENINGTSGADLIEGMGGADRIDGKGGDDCIVGGNAADSLTGGDGNDVLLGEGGADTLNGNDGTDKLYGGAAADTMNGGAGDDTLDGGAAADRATGGPDNDSCVAESKNSCES